MTTTATKTVRRTAKITTKPYTPAALTRVYDKATGVCLGYLAPSRDGREYYQITCDDNAIWHCTCKATIENCCHVKAAKELCAIRVKQGRPACRAASLPEEMSEDDKAQLAIVVAKMSEDVTAELVATPVARELRCFRQWGEYTPQYRDENGDWQNFKNEHGYSVVFLGGYADLAWKYIAVDSDEHRAAVWAELLQAVADAEAADAAQSQAEPVRDLVAVAQSNAAQAGPAIDKAFAESERRLTSTLKAGRGIGLAPIVAPAIAAGRAVPMR